MTSKKIAVAAAAAAAADSDNYQARVFNIAISGFATLTMALGTELGLFKAMDELGRPVTAAELAHKASCKERYVREWLLQMAMVRVLEMDDTGTLFNLPPGGMQALSNVMGIAPMVPRYASSHGELVEAFKSTGPRGVSPGCARPILSYFATTKAPHWSGMFTSNASPEMADLVALMETGVTVLDVGCDTGDCCLAAATQFPKSTFVGIDVFEADVLVAKGKAAERGITNVQFEAHDATHLPASWGNKFDAILLFDTLHDIPLASQAVVELTRALKPRGTVFVSENTMPSDPKEQMKFPLAPMLYTASLYHCLPLSMGPEDSEALGPCLGKERVQAILEAAGLQCKSLRPVSCSYSADRMQYVYVKP